VTSSSSARTSRLSWASSLALAVPACVSNSDALSASNDTPAEHEARPTAPELLQQDPTRATPNEADEPLQPSPRWRSLHGPMNGQQDSDTVSLFYESVEFDTDMDSPATMSFIGLRYAHCGDSWALDAEIASPRVTVDDELGDESGGAFFAAGGVSTNWMLSESLALQPRAGIGYGQCEVSLPQQPPLGRAATDLEWFQGDITLAASYLPSADSEYALSPSGGVGFRYVDGFHQFDDGLTREFDAALTYGFVGAHWSQCVGESSRWALEAMAMVGQIEGFQFSMSFIF